MAADVASISINFVPSGTNFLIFDPINVDLTVAVPDHSIGDNSTAQGAGVEATSAANYTALIDSKNLAQNSWNMEFFNNFPFDIFDPNAVGAYTIILVASLDELPLASTEITVLVTAPVAIPEPASGILLLVGLAGIGVLRRRRVLTNKLTVI